MKRIFGIFLCLFLLSGCGAAGEAAASTRYLTAMDTVMTLTAYGTDRDRALDEAAAEIRRLDSLLSIGNDSSDISRLNREKTAVLSPDAASLLGSALDLARDTQGVFDPTVYPLVKLWGFYDKDYHVPSRQELSQALDLVDYREVSLGEDGQASLGPGQQIDLGGIGKGFTSQRVTELLRDAGITSAMVSLGGNIQCLGAKPDGSPWNIGIRDPFGEDVYAAVRVTDKAVITSGGYERYFKDPETGIIYRHILDPRTGFPAERGLSSVTVITSDGTLGDGLSTALYIMGLEDATRYWQNHRDAFEAVFITDDGTLYATEGLRGSLTSQHDIHYLP